MYSKGEPTMPVRPSGEIKTINIKQKQKNGDIYVIERKIIYIAEKKYNKVLSSRIIGKIMKGTNVMVPTRPKSRKAEKSASPMDSKGAENGSGKLTASRKKIGMMDIISHIGNVSGIDDAVYDSTEDLGMAQKIISLARYLLATNGQTLPGITTWQYTHPLPYEDEISEDIYHELFEKLGRDETLQQNFFKERAKGLKDKPVLAYDSSTVSTYSENLTEARQGFNKAGDGLDTVKILTLYSIENRQPLAFTKQPGNLADVVGVENALAQLVAIGIRKAEIVTDNGYYSERNLAEMLLAHFSFITLAKINLSWIRAELEAHLGNFSTTTSACPFEPATHGITLKIMYNFAKTRKYNGKDGKKKGDTEEFTRRIYLHLFFNQQRRNDEDIAFDSELLEIRRHIESGAPIEDLSQSAKEMVAKFMTIKTYGKNTKVAFREAEISKHKKFHGFFALVSNSEKDTFTCLAKYRKREMIEEFFKAGKQKADGTRTRVWYTDNLRGRMFVQFVTLCYYEYFSEMLRQMKKALGKSNGNPDHDQKMVLDDEKELLSWLRNTPSYLILQWFDVIEEVKISDKLQKKRWNTKMTERDKLFLNKLGMNTEN